MLCRCLDLFLSCFTRERGQGHKRKTFYCWSHAPSPKVPGEAGLLNPLKCCWSLGVRSRKTEKQELLGQMTPQCRSRGPASVWKLRSHKLLDFSPFLSLQCLAGQISQPSASLQRTIHIEAWAHVLSPPHPCYRRCIFTPASHGYWRIKKGLSGIIIGTTDLALRDLHILSHLALARFS